MFWDDLRKLLAGPQLYRLESLISGRLVPIFYALGLGAIGLWAIDHLFASFAFNFGQGLWGILEILVYGPLWLIGLRIVVELILVFLKAHEASAGMVNRTRGHNTLLEDVGDAIHELAEDDDTIGPATDPSPLAANTGGASLIEPGPGLGGSSRRRSSPSAKA